LIPQPGISASIWLVIRSFQYNVSPAEVISLIGSDAGQLGPRPPYLFI